MQRIAFVIVDWCWRRAAAVTIIAAILAVVLAVFAARNLGLDTDENKLISKNLPFRQVEQEIDRAFPDQIDRIAVVIDASTAELAEEAVERLRAALARSGGPILGVERPTEEMFFRKNGLLFLSVSDLTQVAEKLIQAQPMLGAVARDPSLRGLLSTVDLMLQGVSYGQMRPEDMAPLMEQLDRVAAAVAEGRPAHPIDWQSLMASGPAHDTPRRFLMVQPKLDYGELEAGAEASQVIRETAAKLGLTPDNSYQVRQTGSVALSDANFATVTEGVEISAPLSLLAVVILLFWGVRSTRVVIAIMVSLMFGLVATAAFAAATVGSLNPISVAFAVLFVGIAVDFGIQFVTAFRAARFEDGDPTRAMGTAARGMAAPLSLAAVATAMGFLSFLPTAYTGVSQLGLIAGGGMIIALVVDFTLLPALLALLKPPPEREPVGLKLGWADSWLQRHAKPVVGVALGLSLLGALLLPVLPLDFDPLHLQDPKAEAVATFLDLAKDPDTGVYGVETLAPSVAKAGEVAARFETLPEVGRVMTVETFIPDDQDEKLALVADAAGVLYTTLSPARVLPPPNAAELQALVLRVSEKLMAVAPDLAVARSLSGHLARIAEQTPETSVLFQKHAAAGLPSLLDGIRLSLSAEPLALDTLPDALKKDWIATDGRTRVKIQPKADLSDQVARERFVRAVMAVSPNVAGAPISMEESGKVVIHAFGFAAMGALGMIAILLGLMLRRVLDSVLVVAPLVMGFLCTVVAAKALGLSLNFANVIALPLLLGIGVAFNIYFVVNWRNGVTAHLQSPTTRAVLFSAMTTGSAFGALALSPHLGTASMGVLLFLSLGLSVTVTFLVLPALFHLLGKPRP